MNNRNNDWLLNGGNVQNLTPSARILVADDEPEVSNCLSSSLRRGGYFVTYAKDGEEVLRHLRARGASGVSLVLLGRGDGIETLREIRQTEKNLPVIMLSDAPSTRTIVEAMKCGANDFLTKPAGNEQLREAIQQALSSKTVAQEMVKPLVGPMIVREHADHHSWMSKMEGFLNRVGASDAPVLLNGETGSGKEVLARKLHSVSRRAIQPFVKLNCAALPSDLVESELFGFEKGAFTGAFKSKPGKFTLADGGAVLLDEIGDMDIRLQAKLLRVLQDGEFEPLGGNETFRVDVRVMAATHIDLEKAIRDGRFREDLYYRLNVVNIHVPPLRERPNEIPSLAEYFLHTFATPGVPIPRITPELNEALLAYAWPGNIRELQNFMRRYLVTQDAHEVAEELRANSHRACRSVAALPVPSVVASQSNSVGPTPMLENVLAAQKHAEVEAILSALQRTRWNRKQAAAILGVEYKPLLYKLRKLGIDRMEAAAAPDDEIPWGARSIGTVSDPILNQRVGAGD